MTSDMRLPRGTNPSLPPLPSPPSTTSGSTPQPETKKGTGTGQSGETQGTKVEGEAPQEEQPVEERKFIKQQVDIQGKKYNITVGYNEKALSEKYGVKGDALEETIKKVVLGLKPQDILALSGAKVQQAHLQGKKSLVTYRGGETVPLSQLGKKRETRELAKAIDHISRAFDKSNVQKMIKDSKAERHTVFDSPQRSSTSSSPPLPRTSPGNLPPPPKPYTPTAEELERVRNMPLPDPSKLPPPIIPPEPKGGPNVGPQEPPEDLAPRTNPERSSQTETPQPKKKMEPPPTLSTPPFQRTDRTRGGSLPELSNPPQPRGQRASSEPSPSVRLPIGGRRLPPLPGPPPKLELAPEHARELEAMQSTKAETPPRDPQVSLVSTGKKRTESESATIVDRTGERTSSEPKSQNPMGGSSSAPTIPQSSMGSSRLTQAMRQNPNQFASAFEMEVNTNIGKALASSDSKVAAQFLEKANHSLQDLEELASHNPDSELIGKKLNEAREQVTSARTKLNLSSEVTSAAPEKETVKIEKMTTDSIKSNSASVKKELSSLSVEHKNLAPDDPRRAELKQKCDAQIEVASKALKNTDRKLKKVFQNRKKRMELKQAKAELEASISVLKAITGEKRAFTLNENQQRVVALIKEGVEEGFKEKWNSSFFELTTLLSGMKPEEHQQIVDEMVLQQIESPGSATVRPIQVIGGMNKAGVTLDYNGFMERSPLGKVEQDVNQLYAKSPKKLQEDAFAKDAGLKTAVSGLAQMHRSTLEALGVAPDEEDNIDHLVQETEQKLSQANTLGEKLEVVKQFRDQLKDLHTRFVDKVEQKIDEALPELKIAREKYSAAERDTAAAKNALKEVEDRKGTEAELKQAQANLEAMLQQQKIAQDNLSQALLTAKPQMDQWKQAIQDKLPQYRGPAYQDFGEKHGFEAIKSQMKSPAAVDVVADSWNDALKAEDKVKALDQPRIVG